jgi:outer membrane biosynthesis protein TonB
MKKSLIVSLVLHALLVGLLIWSDALKFGLMKTQKERMAASGITVIDLTYRPTDTAMRKGKERKDLPPPDVPPPPSSSRDPSPVVQKKTQKAAPTKKDSPSPKRAPAQAQKEVSSILDRLRKEAAQENRPQPKVNNFPVTEKGEIGARGTGGRSTRTLSPAEMALQAAMRRHFEFPEAQAFRRANPNVEGAIEVSLVGLGNQFRIRSLRVLESTGYALLDRSCERAIRRAIDDETFAPDVIQDLNGKGSSILCRP